MPAHDHGYMRISCVRPPLKAAAMSVTRIFFTAFPARLKPAGSPLVCLPAILAFAVGDPSFVVFAASVVVSRHDLAGLFGLFSFGVAIVARLHHGMTVIYV